LAAEAASRSRIVIGGEAFEAGIRFSESRTCKNRIRDEVEPIGLGAGLFDKAMKEEFMRMKLLVAAAGFAALATPALAAEFYIVQDTGTKRCTIVEQRPTTQTTVVVGNGKAYTTRQEAEGAMKTVKVCESGGTVGGPVPVPR
jgi:hypothetical protein